MRVGRTLARAQCEYGQELDWRIYAGPRASVCMGMIMYIYVGVDVCMDLYIARLSRAGRLHTYIHTYVKGENVHVTQRRLTCRFAS